MLAVDGRIMIDLFSAGGVEEACTVGFSDGSTTLEVVDTGIVVD